jgi:transposase-like protein
MDTFNEPRFTNNDAARVYLENLRWPDGPICPHCGTINRAYKIKPAGTYRCGEPECRGNFTVTMNSPMERSHIALHKWVLAFHLVCSSKKGMSAHQLHRTLGITYRSAWFMEHRIRECMRAGGLAPPMGGTGKTVEADETYFGTIPKNELMPRAVGPGKTKIGKRAGIRRSAYRAVLSLVERGGTVRSFHVAQADQVTVDAIMRANIDRETRINTDESGLYRLAPWTFASHEAVKHSAKEYVRGDVHTNTIEGYFSIFKRGMKGVYQHCGEKHLHRYLAEFDFRYNTRTKLGFNDGDRAALAVKNADGKRLTYRQPH